MTPLEQPDAHSFFCLVHSFSSALVLACLLTKNMLSPTDLTAET